MGVYGRGGMGKSYVVRNVLGDKFGFDMCGCIEGGGEGEVCNLGFGVREYGDWKEGIGRNWREGFEGLKELLKGKMKREGVVVFMDEVGWLDRGKCGLEEGFEEFWKGWGG